MGTAIIWLIDTAIFFVNVVVIAWALLSWLIAFNVVNPRNAFVYQVGRFLEAVADPLLKPIRKIVPLLGGIDVSPVILLLALQFLGIVVHNTLAPILVSALG
ncbi:YggT family protein [Caulobacter sp. 17J80-11]|uniref:YggT family protein n=1 Tax=Caulobacter sp. 17J80-11 TaxID=2763502 RepID=UPI00165385EA|nr:YggT family protein [Caulobacter sp. 17J80-11]MBC6981464.1 YggT family protein [Caulobacter sp. 17J80-11]